MGGSLASRDAATIEAIAQDPQLKAQERTQELCVASGKHCIAGYETAYGNFLLFDRRGQAEYWQEVLGDESRRNGSVLVDLSGRTFTVQEKQAAVDALFSYRDWS